MGRHCDGACRPVGEVTRYIWDGDSIYFPEVMNVNDSEKRRQRLLEQTRARSAPSLQSIPDMARPIIRFTVMSSLRFRQALLESDCFCACCCLPPLYPWTRIRARSCMSTAAALLMKLQRIWMWQKSGRNCS